MKKIIIAVVAAFASVFAMATPANAAIYAYEGKDYVVLNNAATKITVYDKECDGNGFYARFKDTDGFQSVKLYDGNGCSAGGSTYTVPSWAAYFKGCENRNLADACSTWKPVRIS